MPGVIAFIANLITPMSSTAGLDATWMDAYADGTAFELYSTPLARDFEGVRFSDAVSVVFQGAWEPWKCECATRSSLT